MHNTSYVQQPLELGLNAGMEGFSTPNLSEKTKSLKHSGLFKTYTAYNNLEFKGNFTRSFQVELRIDYVYHPA
jgi:hypothetical protein